MHKASYTDEQLKELLREHCDAGNTVYQEDRRCCPASHITCFYLSGTG